MVIRYSLMNSCMCHSLPPRIPRIYDLTAPEQRGYLSLRFLSTEKVVAEQAKILVLQWPKRPFLLKHFDLRL